MYDHLNKQGMYSCRLFPAKIEIANRKLQKQQDVKNQHGQTHNGKCMVLTHDPIKSFVATSTEGGNLLS